MEALNASRFPNFLRQNVLPDSSFVGIIVISEREMTHYLQLMKTLPPLVSVVVWEVINDRIDENTIELAQAASKEEFERYDLIRCVVAADPRHPPIDLAKGLVDEMVENLALVQ
jgi:hypothetical protein